MKLTAKSLKDPFWEAIGADIPPFDVVEMQTAGRKLPRWIHIGPGNIFRVFLARMATDMMADGEPWPVTVVETMEPERLDLQLRSHDLLTLGVTLNPDGTQDLRVIAGIADALAIQREADRHRLTQTMRDASVSLVSFTITEKGYVTKDPQGAFTPQIASLVNEGPTAVTSHAMGLVAQMLWQRFDASKAPLTLLSCDNFSHNGDVLRNAVIGIAIGWERNGLVASEFVQWVQDRTQVAFPVSVIDKITPQPDAEVAALLVAKGIEGMDINHSQGAPLAGFVNTEPTEYLIVEDQFAGDRPPLEEFGAQVVAREVCDSFERMKVTTCLNPLHTALALSGCLLRFRTIDAEMRDPALSELARRLGEDEGMPVVTDPGIVNPHEFLREVLEVRFPNPYLPDSPGRIAADTSQKLPIRFGETLKEYSKRGLDVSGLNAIALTFALWLRYLIGVDDQGCPMELSPDPRLEQLRPRFAEIKLGEAFDGDDLLRPILSDSSLFGVDLYGVGLAEKVKNYFLRLCSGVGAVRKTIDMEMSVA